MAHAQMPRAFADEAAPAAFHVHNDVDADSDTDSDFAFDLVSPTAASSSSPPATHGGPVAPVLPHPRFSIPSSGDGEGIRTVPLPGVRCPKCAKDGKEVWVIQGRACGYCGTACV